MTTRFHTPVMLEESLEGLKVRKDGVYVDVTFGGGGHSAAILDRLTTGKLYSFDQDGDVVTKVASKWSEDLRFTFFNANFTQMSHCLQFAGASSVDGILADFGVSSFQLDSPERGFSVLHEGNLDMRMNQSVVKNAETVINTYSEAALVEVFSKYGEVRNARTLARSIVSARLQTPIMTTRQLRAIVEPLAPHKKFLKYLSQVFQAIRIEVNDELDVIKELLEQSVSLLKPGGRLVIMSYHSLEDRMVKRFFNKGNFDGGDNRDLYGNTHTLLTPINKKPIVPSVAEIGMNRRSRSAKLRIAQKV